MLAAAERVLERDGLAGLTLRAVAREAGVSHAAPTHHFGDLTGLLSELAAIGFRRFNEAMAAAGRNETHSLMKALARAKAFISECVSFLPAAAMASLKRRNPMAASSLRSPVRSPK